MRGLHDAGVDAGLDRRVGGPDRGARPPGHQGRGPHRLPRVPRRPGQDAAPPRARRHPRRPSPRLPRRAARRARGRAVRPRRLQPLPVHRRPSPRAPRPTSASSRSTSAVPRWSAPRPRTTPRSRSSPRPHRYADVLAAVAAGGFTLAQRQRAGRRGVRAHRDVRRRTWRPGWATCSPTPPTGTGFPAWIGGTWDKAAVLRYGENPHQRAALYRNGFAARPAWPRAEQLHGKEMSYNNYVDTDAARRAAYDFDRAGRGDHQARQPVRHRGRRRRRRGAPPGPRVRPDLGVRRRDRGQPCRSRSRWREQVAEIFTEVIVAPAYDDGAVEVLAGQEEHPDPGLRAADAGAAVETAPDQRRAAAAAASTTSTPRATTRRPGRWRPARRPRPRCSPTSPSPGRPAARRSPTRSCWPRTAPRSASAWARSTASTPAGSPSTRAGERAAGAVAASDAFFPFEDGPQILIDAGVGAIVQPGGSVRDELTIEAGRGRGRDDVLHRHPALRPLTPAGGGH